MVSRDRRQMPLPSSHLPLLFVRVFCVAVECDAAAACAGKNWAKVFLVQAEPSRAEQSRANNFEVFKRDRELTEPGAENEVKTAASSEQ